jgi:molecular chaperone GrpE (heat shock protein)
MSESELNSEEKEFAEQLKSLSTEAQQQIGTSLPESLEESAQKLPSALKDSKRADLDSKQALTILQLIRPLVMGIEALSRATSDNSVALSKLQDAVAIQVKLPEMLSDIQHTLDQKNLINQQLFDSLHAELKSYKDNFLLDVFHKPIVRDLVTLYDDLSEIRRQNMSFEGELRDQKSLPENSLAVLERMATLNSNMDHSVASLLEVMARMDVQLMDASTGKLDKTKHRAVAVEVTEDKEDNNDIIRTVKRGFCWRDRIIRPEEVIIKKWKEGYLIAIGSNSGQ